MNAFAVFATKAVQLVLSFLRDDKGAYSSSRLVAVGGANIMAVYLLADIVARFSGNTPMNENVMLTCVGTLGLLGGAVYGTNKLAEVKSRKKDDEEVAQL